MKITPEDVLRVIKDIGPCVPNQIKQRLGQSDSTLISVYISELKNEGKIRITNLQLGSSKFSYTPEQTPKLEQLMEHLNEKDRRTAAKLREEGVIRAATAEPLTRVSLGNIPDFARPITVKLEEGEETFYRWFLLSSEEAQEKIKKIMGVKEEPEQTEQKVEEEPREEKEAEKQNVEEKVEQRTKYSEPKFNKEPQKKLIEVEAESKFAKQLIEYFDSKNILLREFHEVRSNSEIDCVIELPSAVGNIPYFCKAKNKKNSNDGDLASAILQAKKRMLPSLYITTGSVTQKAKKAPELQEVQVVELGSKP